MKLFFISDIHGNEYALAAILAKAIALGADHIYCMGDLSGYFTGINEVIALLKEHHVVAIKGNHDGFLTEELPVNEGKSYYSAYLKTKQILLTEELNWLEQLPSHQSINIDDHSLAMYHGGPNDLLNEYVFPDSIDFEKYRQHPAELLLFGHTHLQFVVKDSGRIFANPGSVGLPRNGDFRAHGLMYDTKERLFTEYRIPYDVNKLNDKYLNETSVNRKFLHNINFGRSSNRTLIDRDEFLLDQEMIFNMRLNGISIINTKFGIILSYSEDRFLDNLLYVACYEDGSLEMTSNTLLFNWQVGLFEEDPDQLAEKSEFKKDMAGFYYYKFFPEMKEFRTKILETTKQALHTIKKIKNKNVYI